MSVFFKTLACQNPLVVTNTYQVSGIQSPKNYTWHYKVYDHDLRVNAQKLINTAFESMHGRIPKDVKKITGQCTKIIHGDIHGNIQGMAYNFLAAGIINEKQMWSGGTKTLICTGDYLDKGRFPFETLRYLLDLQDQARSAGGEMVILLGNHELELLQNLIHYPSYYATKPADYARYIQTMIRDAIIDNRIQASYTDGKHLLTHASLHPTLDAHYRDQFNGQFETEEQFLFKIVPYFNKTLRDAAMAQADWQNRNPGQTEPVTFYQGDPMYNFGKAKGGPDDTGGIFYCHHRKEVVEECTYTQFPQIFGHTRIVDDNRFYYYKNTVDIDVGLTFGRASFLGMDAHTKTFEITNPTFEDTYEKGYSDLSEYQPGRKCYLKTYS